MKGTSSKEGTLQASMDAVYSSRQLYEMAQEEMEHSVQEWWKEYFEENKKDILESIERCIFLGPAFMVSDTKLRVETASTAGGLLARTFKLKPAGLDIFVLLRVDLSSTGKVQPEHIKPNIGWRLTR